MTVEVIKRWFALAVPKPTDKNRSVQLGVHFEEVEEMMAPLNIPQQVREPMHKLAVMLKTNSKGVAADALDAPDRLELLDSLCDQIVTAVGVAHMFGMNIEGALAEVNRSNWSKFVEGQPVFDANGKITKGAGYSKPDLRAFV